MISLFGGKSYLHAVKTLTLITALASFAVAPLCLAAVGSSNSGVNLDKHARKVHRALSHFNPGNYIRLTFTDKSERTVALDSLEDTSFTVTNAESNNRETHTYDEIAHVTREKDYIGEGSETHVRHIRLWVPLVGVLAAGAVATALLVR
ncbi:MAG: hypothetical protein ABR928_00575 [Terracidiphilus sp.]|jgi:hypothetical protein